MTGHALIFTDVVDSTLLVERLGDERAALLWADHDRRARDLLARHHGREIDRSDGFFLLFDDPRDAARYALAYHQAMAELALVARAGLHVGPVTLRENAPEDVARGAKRIEVEGLAKPFAARLMALARGGQTLLGADARSALGDALPEGSEIDSHGHYRLKGIEAPIEVCELGVRGACSFMPPADTDKAYRVVRAEGLWRPLREVRHNLPAERDAFIGRRAELRHLAQRLDAGARLLTVLGPGGTGKTRCVRRYALSWLGDWPGGVYFCDLSEARSLDGIFYAVAVALGVPLGKGDAGEQLGHAIAGRGRCLVVLDNFEQVIVHAPATLGRWLDRAAGAAFVVTSRERLHLAGEELLAIEPLPLDAEAIELFVARARAQRPGFALGEANRASVAEVVRLLDGLPLAIELAAARVRVFSPAQLAERMRDRFRILAGARGASARQATLKAAIDWSWDLLTPWEQAALAQSSVFEGGFTLEAAEAVLDLSGWPEAPPVMDAVQALVDKSLLRSWVRTEASRLDIDEPYFGMYLSIHEYALERLDACGPAAQPAAWHRHGRYFAGFGTDDALERLFQHGGAHRRRALAFELDNLVAACHRAIRAGDGNVAVATYRAAWEVLDLQGPFGLGADLGAQVLAIGGIGDAKRLEAWMTRAVALWRCGRIGETRCAFAQALAQGRAARDRKRMGVVRLHLGNLYRELGRAALALARYESALAIGRMSADRRHECGALLSLGNLRAEQGVWAQARPHYEAALAIAREIGNRREEGTILGNLGNMHFEQGRMEEGRWHYEAAIAISEEVGNRRGEASSRGNLGNLCFQQGRLEEARAHYHRALTIAREVGHRRVEGMLLDDLGNVALLKRSIDEARVHYSAALAIAREVRSRRDEAFVLGHLGSLSVERGQIGEARAYLEESLAIHRSIDDRGSVGGTLGSLAELLLREGQVDEARQALQEGELLLTEAGEPMELAKLSCIRGQLALATADRDAATCALAQAQAAAVVLEVGPESELGRDVARLRAALA